MFKNKTIYRVIALILCFFMFFTVTNRVNAEGGLTTLGEFFQKVKDSIVGQAIKELHAKIMEWICEAIVSLGDRSAPHYS